MIQWLLYQGFSVLEANDNLEAFEHFQLRAPAFVLLDILLPRTKGSELCCQPKSHSSTQTIPVVLCSLLGKAFHHWKSQQSADVYFTKPFPPQALLGMMTQLLQLGLNND